MFEQSNESNCRNLVWSTMVGKAKVMGYDEIIEAQAKRDAEGLPCGKENVVRSAKLCACAGRGQKDSEK